MERAQFNFNSDTSTLNCQGSWANLALNGIEAALMRLDFSAYEEFIINGADIYHFDTAGAWLLCRVAMQAEQQNCTVEFKGFSDEYSTLLQWVQDKQAHLLKQPQPTIQHFSFLYLIGEKCWNFFANSEHLFNFLGEFVVNLILLFKNPRQFRIKETLYVIENNGFHALPIIALLSFLIGVVLTYQAGIQLKVYGANIFIVDLSGMAILREFAPLITAIILSGRTSAAYTAELGTMKVGEEIDALRVMGLSPINHLVTPKIIGLLIAFPLLTIWAMLFGLLGAMVMANNMLGVSFYSFFMRFQEVMTLRTLYIGMIKTPVFAFLIAFIGCYQGFQVALNADSVGRQTTRTVVQTIFFIILADAIFSIIFSRSPV